MNKENIIFAITLSTQLLLCLLAAAKKSERTWPQLRVLGPDLKKANLGQFPWHVRIFNYKTGEMHACSGVLIADSWLLTAAHCLYDDVIHIEGGTLSPCSCGYGGESMLSAQIVKHPLYDPEVHNLIHDIALVKTRHPFKVSDTLKPITLPNKTDIVGSGVEVILTGWGQHKSPDASLEYVPMKTITDEVCKKSFAHVTEGVMCTSGPNSACSGDGGGGLIKYVDEKPVLVGISSFSRLYYCDGPSGFKRVTYYRDWIKEITGL